MANNETNPQISPMDVTYMPLSISPIIPTSSQQSASVQPLYGLSPDHIRFAACQRQRIRRSRQSPSARTSTNSPDRARRIRRLADETIDEAAARRAIAAQRQRERRKRQFIDQLQSVNPGENSRGNVYRPSLLCRAAFSYDPDYDYSNHPLIIIGNPDLICSFCNARRFLSESEGLCCAKGKVRLSPIEQPPEPILTLYSGDYQESRQFLKSIRRYNSCFQMTSFDVTGNISNDGWMPTFRIQGQIYHRIGSLLPMHDAKPQFLQVYFTGDEELRLDHRCNRFHGVKRNIIANFQELFDLNNTLISI